MTNRDISRPSILGLITARGGSKGVPGKNIAELAGKPLIGWTIEAAGRSPYLDRVVVTTDATEIAEIARLFGADVPFMRPPELARDNSSHQDVTLHAINWLKEKQDYRPDYVMLLQPTSPLRTVEDIDNAAILALTEDADAVISVYPSPVHPFFMKTVKKPTGILIDYMDKPKGYLPRQSLETVYALNGAVYLMKSDLLLRGQTWSDVDALPYIMPESRSLDIDNQWDMHLAGLIMREQYEK